MSKVKVIKKKSAQDPELLKLFNQMVGNETPDPSVIMPKYEFIIDMSKSIIKVFETVFFNNVYIPENIKINFSKGFSEIRSFIEKSNKELNKVILEKNKTYLTPEELNKINDDPELMQKHISSMENGYNADELCEKYKQLKESDFINSIIITTRDIKALVDDDKKKYKKEITDIEIKEKLSDSFIRNCTGDFLQIIPGITKLDFKLLWIDSDCSYEFKKRIIYALHLIVNKSILIINEVMKPDIDINKFADLLINSISEIKKSIPRCDKAFSKIANSVNLLKDNFGSYYKEFVISNNSGVFIENFILDIADKETTDPETLFQFKTIIAFYKKQLQGKINDPNMNKLFDLLGENMDILEKGEAD